MAAVYNITLRRRHPPRSPARGGSADGRSDYHYSGARCLRPEPDRAHLASAPRAQIGVRGLESIVRRQQEAHARSRPELMLTFHNTFASFCAMLSGSSRSKTATMIGPLLDRSLNRATISTCHGGCCQPRQTSLGRDLGPSRQDCHRWLILGKLDATIVALPPAPRTPPSLRTLALLLARNQEDLGVSSNTQSWEPPGFQHRRISACANVIRKT